MWLQHSTSGVATTLYKRCGYNTVQAVRLQHSTSGAATTQYKQCGYNTVQAVWLQHSTSSAATTQYKQCGYNTVQAVLLQHSTSSVATTLYKQCGYNTVQAVLHVNHTVHTVFQVHVCTVQTCLHDFHNLNEFVHVFPGSHESLEHEPLEVLVHLTVDSTHHLDNKTKATCS